MTRPDHTLSQTTRDFDLDALLHPALAFKHPSDVVADPNLTLNEKRAILASWASDACAVESGPALRARPGTQPVSVDEILEALRGLDKEAHATAAESADLWQPGRRRIERFRFGLRRDRGDSNRGLSH